MLAVFENSIGRAPADLRVSANDLSSRKTGSEIADFFSSSRPGTTICKLPEANVIALSHQTDNPLLPRKRHETDDQEALGCLLLSLSESLAVVDDIYCLFIGTVENICDLRHHYGLSRNTSEALLVVEVYKVLRDRAPYPADQVIRDIVGHYAFVLFDFGKGNLFAARDRDGRANLHWGFAKDESLVFSDDGGLVRESCGASSGPFPQGCIFMSSNGLQSFVHPMYKVRAVRQVDDQGLVRGVNFMVDLYTRLHSMPRVGSNSNWANATVVE